MSIGLSFHCRTGSFRRERNRLSCSWSETENQYLRRRMPSSMSICSKIGVCRMNRLYSCGVQKPMTCSTPGAVVPGAVEQDDLAGRGQVRDVALVVPLGLLALGRRRECGDAHDARAEVLRDPLDGAALAGGVATLEDHDHPGSRRLGPELDLDQLGLEAEQLGLVDGVRDLVLVLLLAGLLRHVRTLPPGPDRRSTSASAVRTGPWTPHLRHYDRLRDDLPDQ